LPQGGANATAGPKLNDSASYSFRSQAAVAGRDSTGGKRRLAPELAAAVVKLAAGRPVLKDHGQPSARIGS
jgi:hypothetical protein